jgi:hypothetical protein
MSYFILFVCVVILVIIYVIDKNKRKHNEGNNTNKFMFRKELVFICLTCSKYYSGECSGIKVWHYKLNRQFDCDSRRPIGSAPPPLEKNKYTSNEPYKHNKEHIPEELIEEQWRVENNNIFNKPQCPYCHSILEYAGYGGENPRLQCPNKQCEHYKQIF